MRTYKTTTLKDPKCFAHSNGLWTGKKPPFTKATVIRNTNFRNDGRLDLSDVAVLDVETRQLETRTLQPGDIIIERSGGGPKQPVGRVCYFDEKGSLPFSFSNFTSVLRVIDRASFTPRFVHYFMLHLYYDDFTVALQRQTTGIRNLDFDAYLNAEIQFVPIEDQKRITALLDLLQRSAVVEEEIISATAELKKAALAKLFVAGDDTAGVASGVQSPWSLERLEDCCRVVSSSISYTDFASMPDAPASSSTVRAMGIKVSDMNLPGNESVLRRANLEKSIEARVAEKRLVPPGAVVFPKRGAAIATNKKRLTTAWTVLDPNLIAVVPGERLDVSFLFSWFQKFDLRSITEPGPTPQLNKKNLVPLLVPVPTAIDEQKYIGSILSSIDAKMELHRQKRATVEALFKKLLHDLMTGEIGVDQINRSAAEGSAA